MPRFFVGARGTRVPIFHIKSAREAHILIREYFDDVGETSVRGGLHLLLRAARNVWDHLIPANEWHGCWHCTASTTLSTSNASSTVASSTASLIWLLELLWSPSLWGIRRRRGRLWSPCWWGIRRLRGCRANPYPSVDAPDRSVLGG